VWSATAHPVTSELGADRLAVYSDFPSRQCRCQRGETLHQPRYAAESTDSSLPPCFVPYQAAEQLSRPDVNLRDFRCFFGEDDDYGDNDDIRRRVSERVSECFTPPRSGGSPQRTIFLLADSHSKALAPGLMAAINGAATVVWIGVSFWCGYVSDTYIYADDGIIPELDADHPVIEDWRHQEICEAFTHAIDDALRDNLRACDIVALTHRSYASNGNGKLDRYKSDGVRGAQIEHYRHLQQLVASKDASLVLFGDVPELPKAGTRCSMNPSSCENSVDEVRMQLQVERAAYEELAREDNTFYYPLSDLFCNEETETCGAFVPGTSTLMAGDQDHLLSEASLYLWPFLCAFIFDAGLLGSD